MQRDGRELERQSASGRDAALHGIEELREMPMTGIELGVREGDADDGACQFLVAVAHRLGEGAAHVDGEVAVAVVLQTAQEAALVIGAFGHAAAGFRLVCLARHRLPFELSRDRLCHCGAFSTPRAGDVTALASQLGCARGMAPGNGAAPRAPLPLPRPQSIAQTSAHARRLPGLPAI